MGRFCGTIGCTGAFPFPFPLAPLGGAALAALFEPVEEAGDDLRGGDIVSER